MKKAIMNCETNQLTYEDLTSEEIADYRVNEAKMLEEIENNAKKEIKKQEVATKLGLTLEELQALLG